MIAPEAHADPLAGPAFAAEPSRLVHFGSGHGTRFDLLAAWSDRVVNTGTSIATPTGLTLGVLATALGRYEDADAFYALASEMTHQGSQHFQAADADRWWGEMLAERNAPGDLDRARDLLLRSQTSAAANGYGNVERRTTEALQRIG